MTLPCCEFTSIRQAEVADEREPKHEVVERNSQMNTRSADLEGGDAGHAVVAAELHVADAPLVARRLAEEGLEQQRETPA